MFARQSETQAGIITAEPTVEISRLQNPNCGCCEGALVFRKIGTIALETEDLALPDSAVGLDVIRTSVS